MIRLLAFSVSLFVSSVVGAAPIEAQTPGITCEDRWALETGQGEPTEQHVFNNWDAKAYARYYIACAHGWGTTQWNCLHTLWQEESGWHHLADGAGDTWGIPQAYPGTKMASHGADYRTNPRVQVRWGADYIAARYGVPTNTPNRCHAGY